MACAVSAMIGVRSPASISRIFAVASKPLISGICTSMSTRSNFSPLNFLNRFDSIARQHHRMARLFKNAKSHSLIHHVVFGQKNPHGVVWFTDPRSEHSKIGALFGVRPAAPRRCQLHRQQNAAPHA